MIKNNKGFTVVELIASFVFVSILSISLFGIIMNYRDKEIDSSIEADLLAYKSKLTIDIEQDIQRKGLKNIKYCDSSQINTRESCINLNFNDGETKQFKKYTVKCWKVFCMASESGAELTELNSCKNGAPPVCEADYKDSEEFSYYTTYLSYGGVRYPIPDADNVTIESDNLLEYTVASDALENNLTLYKINVKLTHVDLDADMDISIVATGTEQVNSGDTPYKEYKIGDLVNIQLNANETRDFRVISDSSGYNGSVTLLYDDDNEKLTDKKNSSLEDVFPKERSKALFNSDVSQGNNYLGSAIEATLNGNQGLSLFWSNADKVRLITVEELANIVGISPNYRRTFDSPLDASENLNGASTAPSWLFRNKYWTSSKVSLKDNEDGNQNGYVWYVDDTTNYMKATLVNTPDIYIRPVIEISKTYINNQ